MATTLGGVTLADPAAGSEGYRGEYRGEGAAAAMADGSLVYYYGNSGSRFHIWLHWNGIINEQWDAITARANVKTAQAFVAPDGETFTVIVWPNSFKWDSFETGTGTTYYNVDLELEETS